MKKIKIIWLSLLFISSAACINAQSGLTIDASQLYASFGFTDSEGNTMNSEYSGIFTGAYGAGYRYILENGIMAGIGAGMRKAGATLVYDDINYTWDLQYVQGKLGAGYMLKKDRFSPYILVSGYYAYLLRGYQTINNENFNVKESSSINETDYGVMASLGVLITLSDAVSAYIEPHYIMGLQNLDKDDNQKAANYAYGLTLGLSFSFVK